jgi:hypothetical protein
MTVSEWGYGDVLAVIGVVKANYLLTEAMRAQAQRYWLRLSVLVRWLLPTMRATCE